VRNILAKNTHSAAQQPVGFDLGVGGAGESDFFYFRMKVVIH
jgi:hypothetical protein